MRLALVLLLATVATPAAAETWLGIRLVDGAHGPGGIVVVDVFEDTAASRCGIRAGDEITAIGRSDVGTYNDLRDTLKKRAVGDKVVVHFFRNGAAKRCSTRLTEKLEATELLDRRLVGKSVPPFDAIRRGDGKAIDEHKTRGRVVVLALFRTSCDCAATIQALSERVGSAELVAISEDSSDAIDAFVQRTGLTVAVARDHGQLVRGYLLENDDAMIVIDHEGIVRFAAVGPGEEGANLDAAALAVSRAERARRRRK